MILRISLCVLLLAGCQSETTTTTSTETTSTATAEATATTAAAPAAAPTSRDVCAMLSADELKTAANVEGAEGKASKSGGADVCTWMDKNSKGVIVQVYPYASSYESARSAFEGLYDTKATSLSGVGDKAFNMNGKTGPFATATVVAQKGTTPVSVQVMSMGSDDATRTKEATAVAQLILGKI